MSARHQMHPSPQQTLVIFQAGTSKSGQAFAAKHAEAVYIGGLVPSQAAHQIKASRAAAVANDRDPYSIKYFAGITPFLGHTLEEAQTKFELAEQHADIIGGLAQFSGYTGIDMSVFPLDEEFLLDASVPSDNAVQSFLGNFTDSVGTMAEPWTPRSLGKKIALGGFHPSPVGMPQMVADVMEEWIRDADVDGFNVAYVSNPGSFQDVVDLLVPVIQRRGLMWNDYAVPQGTFRGNLLDQPGQRWLRNDHYGSSFKFEEKTGLKRKRIDEDD